MSLFSSKQWWHTRLGSGEEFDQGSICVANIDNDPVGTGAIGSSVKVGPLIDILNCWLLQQTVSC